MFRLTREIRFSINDLPDAQLDHPPTNSYGGYPSLTGFGQYFTIQVTLEGKLDRATGYLRNIKDIDRLIREKVIASIDAARQRLRPGDGDLAREIFSDVLGGFQSSASGDKVHSIMLWLTPFLSISLFQSEFPMSRLSQKFEFSASHRLHNPSLSAEENRKTYGKCNHPSGHGHNYEVQVTLRGKPNRNGLLVDVPQFEKIVQEYAIEKLDHKNLNVDLSEFAEVIPTVENIAMVIYKMLKSRFTNIGADLAAVTVWETPKTWCEYSEP